MRCTAVSKVLLFEHQHGTVYKSTLYYLAVEGVQCAVGM